MRKGQRPQYRNASSYAEHVRGYCPSVIACGRGAHIIRIAPDDAFDLFQFQNTLRRVGDLFRRRDIRRDARLALPPRGDQRLFFSFSSLFFALNMIFSLFPVEEIVEFPVVAHLRRGGRILRRRALRCFLPRGGVLLQFRGPFQRGIGEFRR